MCTDRDLPEHVLSIVKNLLYIFIYILAITRDFVRVNFLLWIYVQFMIKIYDQNKRNSFIKQYSMSICETEPILLDKNIIINNSLKSSLTIYFKRALHTTLYDLLFPVSP